MEDGGAAAEQVAMHSSLKPWPTSLDTCLHSYTHAHDPEGIDYHFPGVNQYLNISSG